MYVTQLLGGASTVSARWNVKGIPLRAFKEGGSVGEPFAVIGNSKKDLVVLTKEAVFYEGDEEKSSTHEKNQQLERERG